MSVVKEALANAWEKLNPADPSPYYLAKFMAFALMVFAVGLSIGALAV